MAAVVRGVVEDDDEGKLELSVEEGVSKSLKNSSSSTVAVVVAASEEEGISNSKKNCGSSMVDDNGTASGSREAKLARVVAATLKDWDELGELAMVLEVALGNSKDRKKYLASLSTSSSLTRAAADVEVDVEADVEVDVEVDVEADVEVDVEADVEVEAGVDVEVDVEAKTEVDVEAETEVDVVVDGKAEAGVDDKVDVDDEADVDVEAWVWLSRSTTLEENHFLLAFKGH